MVGLHILIRLSTFWDSRSLGQLTGRFGSLSGHYVPLIVCGYEIVPILAQQEASERSCKLKKSSNKLELNVNECRSIGQVSKRSELS